MVSAFFDGDGDHTQIDSWGMKTCGMMRSERALLHKRKKGIVITPGHPHYFGRETAIIFLYHDLLARARAKTIGINQKRLFFLSLSLSLSLLPSNIFSTGARGIDKSLKLETREICRGSSPQLVDALDGTRRLEEKEKNSLAYQGVVISDQWRTTQGGNANHRRHGLDVLYSTSLYFLRDNKNGSQRKQ